MVELDWGVVRQGGVKAVEEGTHHVANVSIGADCHGDKDFARI